MSEVLVRYTATVRGNDGSIWTPQACGGVASDGLWEGWIEFVSDDRAVRTGRETEQPNRDALMYWAQGLTGAYLEGALARATTTRAIIPREPRATAHFDGPAPRNTGRSLRPSRAILDPFSTFAQGEDLLRRQLNALSHDNLVAIVEDYVLPINGVADIRRRSLVEAIIDAVKAAGASSSQRPVAETDLDIGQRP